MEKYEKVLGAIKNLLLTHEIRNKERYTVNMPYKDSTSVTAWNITQLHTVGLIKERGHLNNSSLAELLGISKAAVTKITKKLASENVIAESGDIGNKKEKFFSLTLEGEKLALIHEDIQIKAVNRYIEVCESFTEQELSIVADFIDKITQG